MTNIHDLQDLLAYDINLSISRKSLRTNITFTLVGVTLTIIGTQINATDTLNYTLGICGFLITIIGIGNLLSNNSQLIYNTTNEPLIKYKLYFHKKDEHTVTKLLKEGNTIELSQKAIETGPLQVIIYATASRHYFIAQLFLFTPYQYSPYSQPIIYTQ